MLKITILIFSLFFSSCGTPFDLYFDTPLVSYASYDSGDSVLTITGSGFSSTYNENFLSVSSYLIPAVYYSVEGGEEELEFEIPNALAPGDYTAQILVNDVISSSFDLVID